MCDGIVSTQSDDVSITLTEDAIALAKAHNVEYRAAESAETKRNNHESRTQLA